MNFKGSPGTLKCLALLYSVSYNGCGDIQVGGECFMLLFHVLEYLEQMAWPLLLKYTYSYEALRPFQ